VQRTFCTRGIGQAPHVHGSDFGDFGNGWGGAELASWEVLVICAAVPIIIEANGDSDINSLEFMEGCRQTRDPAVLRGDCRNVAQI
jgi:hypothetical protein